MAVVDVDVVVAAAAVARGRNPHFQHDSVTLLHISLPKALDQME